MLWNAFENISLMIKIKPVKWKSKINLTKT